MVPGGAYRTHPEERLTRTARRIAPVEAREWRAERLRIWPASATLQVRLT
jgi:hypothetical protein